MTGVLICDMDGTLNHCNVYYNEASRRVVDQLVCWYPEVPRPVVERLVTDLNLLSIQCPDPWSSHRFPTSLAAAGAAVAVLAGRTDTMAQTVSTAHWLGQQVFEAEYELYPEVLDVLELARRAGWRVIVFTKGDPAVQWRKIKANALEDVAECVVTPSKDVKQWQALLERLQVDPGRPLVVVGDSLKDDIAPAQALGAYTVQAAYGDTTWPYNNHRVVPHEVITTFSALLPILEARGKSP